MNVKWMEQLTQKYVNIPHKQLYVRDVDLERLDKGDSVLAYVDVDEAPEGSYVRIDTLSLQPAIKIDDNTYDVVFILV